MLKQITPEVMYLIDNIVLFHEEMKGNAGEEKQNQAYTCIRHNIFKAFFQIYLGTDLDALTLKDECEMAANHFYQLLHGHIKQSLPESKIHELLVSKDFLQYENGIYQGPGI